MELQGTREDIVRTISVAAYRVEALPYYDTLVLNSDSLSRLKTEYDDREIIIPTVKIYWPPLATTFVSKFQNGLQKNFADEL